MMGSGYGAALSRYYGCMAVGIFAAGGGVGIFFWWAIPALCRFIARHWH